MKALKDCMNKMNPFASTKSQSISGAGPEKKSARRFSGTEEMSAPEEVPAPKSFLFSRTSTPKSSKQGQPRKGITRVSDIEWRGMYEIKGHVMESAHQCTDVLFGRRLSDNEEVVVKTRDKTTTSFKEPQEERVWRETVTAQLNMPKIESMCEYIAVYETREKYYIVMERIEGMDLFEHLQRGRMKQEDARQITFQILKALEAMHASGRIHRDLKLENVVANLSSSDMCRIGSNGFMTSVQAKLIDFDIAEDWEPTRFKAEEVLGTAGYIAPEAYAGVYSPASDIYGVGVIMYKLLTRRFPTRREIFDYQPGENWVGSPAMKRIQDHLKNERVDFERKPLNNLPDAQGLLKKMMAFDISERPSAAEALGHPWFQLVGDERTGRAACRSNTAGTCSSASSSWLLGPQLRSAARSDDGSTISPECSLDAQEVESPSLPGELA
jgi:serine/threonine protein kinase